MTVPELEAVLAQPGYVNYTTAAIKDEAARFLDFIKHKETIQVCGRCRWRSGCDTCCYKKALASVLRKGGPPAWWLKTLGAALRAGEAQ